MTDKVIELNKENFKEVIQGKVLVDFWASWCGPCMMLKPFYESLSEEINEVTFAKCSTEQFPEIASEQDIQGIPCILYFENGKEVNRIVGFYPKEELKSKILEIISN